MGLHFLAGADQRGKYLRYDTAVILKRFFLAEQALVVGMAGWLPSIGDISAKLTIPKIAWEDAMTAQALRERVFELKFPSRILDVGNDAALVNFIRNTYRAPNEAAFLMLMARLYKPALKTAYESYLALADVIGDGPTYRFLRLAVQEQQEHAQIIESLLVTYPAETLQASADWVERKHAEWRALGGITLDASTSVRPALQPDTFQPSQTANRGQRFKNVRFYWPDIIDSGYPYGDGMQLQLRSAISHLNEVWAVENGGYVLFAFAEQLGWEFVFDAARWVYDESRHCQMGYRRLKSWGFEDEEIPLGNYIYESCKGCDPIYRLGMLFYFESKNIGKKIERIRSFERMNDRVSQHDMDFDWADETIHTSYGKKWLSKVLELRGGSPDDYTETKTVCDTMVNQVVASVTADEAAEIQAIATGMIRKATDRSRLATKEEE